MLRYTRTHRHGGTSGIIPCRLTSYPLSNCGNPSPDSHLLTIFRETPLSPDPGTIPGYNGTLLSPSTAFSPLRTARNPGI